MAMASVIFMVGGVLRKAGAKIDAAKPVYREIRLRA
jgi:hypothetical protein